MKMGVNRSNVVSDCVRNEVGSHPGADKPGSEDGHGYRELGGNYLEQINKNQLQRYLESG
jgi:hypothetical protein